MNKLLSLSILFFAWNVVLFRCVLHPIFLQSWVQLLGGASFRKLYSLFVLAVDTVMVLLLIPSMGTSRCPMCHLYTSMLVKPLEQQCGFGFFTGRTTTFLLFLATILGMMSMMSTRPVLIGHWSRFLMLLPKNSKFANISRLWPL